MKWPSLTFEQIRLRVLEALEKNKSFREHAPLGVPGTFLDQQIFPHHPFLEQAPFLKTLVENPNHIGCHTFGDSERFFEGTQELEREVIKICAEQIMKGESYDGHVCSGGTEGNIQGVWMGRNYFQERYGVQASEIALIYTADAHYSASKAVNLLGLHPLLIEVDRESRELSLEHLASSIEQAQERGIEHFIVFLTMGTTMFGSVDDVEAVIKILKLKKANFRVHIDAAFGGFIYPFTMPDQKMNFELPEIQSIVLDAHKMLQAPYGTGIFLCRKGGLNSIIASDASYVSGLDSTLCGSRSGANAIAIWMILNIYGGQGGIAFCQQLVAKSLWFCQQLEARGIRYFHQEGMNIITLYAEDIDREVALKFDLVPKCHGDRNKWWKVVVMEHVSKERLEAFLSQISALSPRI
jgi:tyrosine decarboxylase / aspartate 1-decarboxylase